MELRQKQELRKLLVPELNQSLKILTLPLLELRSVIEEELLNNPFLEDASPPLPFRSGRNEAEEGPKQPQISEKLTLQDVLLRQLGMFTDSDEEFKIGYEIIGNIDDNGYLKASLEEISKTLDISQAKVEKTLKLIQQFEPAGVGARTVSECLLIQLDLANENDPLLRKIIESHLEDVAKKNYTRIAKSLNQPLEKIKPLLKIISRLDPKPGRNYSAEETQHVVPDITIYDKEDEFEITVNDEDIPTLNINKDYRAMLKKSKLDPQTKEYLAGKLKTALELMRSVFRRKATLRRIVEAIAEIQQEAIRQDLSHLKPLTFQEVAKILNVHESTVCRAIMNKYARLPYGVVALKEFFSSSIKDTNGFAHSSTHIKRLLKELIENEDKKNPLSDQDIVGLLADYKNIKISRRTVAKYREELKILSTSFRREK
jgi:RNA polymerase sigma-54 factor